MKIVFMGTPDFAVQSLKALIEAGHEIAGVFTQPDKPKNRGHKLQPPPVKECALEHNLTVYQPLSLRKGEDGEKSLTILKSLAPDCIVVAAYGQILPKSVLDLPPYGCINVHASLLPMYRGAAPVQKCVMDGQTETGVTTMYMGEGLDTGDMILKEKVLIPENMTGTQLYAQLSDTGAKLLVKTLEAVQDGTAPRIPQIDDNTCYAPMITKEICRINFSDSAKNVYNHIRGLSEVPGAYTFLDGKRLKVYFSEIVTGNFTAAPGTVVDADAFTVACGDGNGVSLTDIQPEGGKRMSVRDYLRGRRIQPGAICE